jgi:hypothetical protein
MNGRIVMGLRGAAIAVMLMCALPAMADHHVTLGEWSMVMDFQGQDVPGTMTLTEAEGGGIAGVWTADGEETELVDVKFDGGILTFTRSVDYQDQVFDIDYAGTIDGDSITGAFSTPAGDLATNGTRGGGSDDAGLAGSWILQVDSQLGENERGLNIADDMTAVYVADGEEFEVEDLDLDGDTVTFAVTLELQGQELTLDFEGELDGNSLVGELFMDGSSVAEVEGSRAGGGGGIAPGEYALTVDSQIGEFQHKLTVNDDGSMIYESDGEETEPTNVEVDGTEVYFEVTVNADGQSFDLEFEGTFEDGSLEGEFLLDGGAVAEVYTNE